MSGHLCLKWNNHSSAFLKSINTIQVKERYCDATIACQGKYFPVHRIILSTCSEYFEEMFERIQCQHPYIVFKDIEPAEMELLLNYMYQGEVNVVQEKLPTLIKAAEALKIKGLAVPDDLPTSKDSGKRKSSSENSHSKRRSEDFKKRRGDSTELNDQNLDSATHSVNAEDVSSLQSQPETRFIKEEPLDTSEYGDGTVPYSGKSQPGNEDENAFISFPSTEEPHIYIKQEAEEDKYENQSSSWADFGSGNSLDNLPPPEVEEQDNIYDNSESISQALAQPQYASLIRGVRPDGQMSTSVDFQSFACHICSKQFSFKQNLATHMRIHSGVKPYKCPYCFCKFRHINSLKRHIKNKTQCIKRKQMFKQVINE